MFNSIIFDKEGGKAYITLNQPQTHNALSHEMLLELNEAIRICGEDEEIRVVILTGGEGKAFSSGANLKEGLSDGNLGDTLRKKYNPLILGMKGLQKPIICKMNGLAAGAGMSLALACDVIIATEGVYFTELFVGIGLMPDAGSMFFLPRIIGSLKAFELFSTGRKVYMGEALELGLVNKVVEIENLNSEVEKLADLYAVSATKSIGIMKQVLNQSYNKSLEEVLSLEAEGQTICGYSKDFMEGVMAFMEKRQPVFKGK